MPSALRTSAGFRGPIALMRLAGTVEAEPRRQSVTAQGDKR